MAFEFTDANFKEKALAADTVSVVDFWAEWCGPCRMIGPIVEELANEYDGKALIGKLNVDHNPGVSMEYSVRSIPTILFFKNGKLVKKHVGAASRGVLEAKLNETIATDVEAA